MTRGFTGLRCLLNEGNGDILDKEVLKNTSLDKELMGDDTYLRLRRITDEILTEAMRDNAELATLIDNAVDQVLERANLSDKLKRMFRKCMLNTITTTLVQKKGRLGISVYGRYSSDVVTRFGWAVTRVFESG